MKIVMILLLLILSVTASSAEESSEFFMATDWRTTTKSYRDCILEAKKTLDFVKFSEKLDYQTAPSEDGSGSAWGQRTINATVVYKAVVRCIPSMQVAFFVVAGPSREKVREHTNNLATNFQENTE